MYLEKWEFYAFFIQYALGRISNNLINRTNRHLFNEMPPSITSRTFFCGFSKIYFNLGTAETIIHSWGLELGNFKLFWRLSKFSSLDTQLYPFQGSFSTSFIALQFPSFPGHVTVVQSLSNASFLPFETSVLRANGMSWNHTLISYIDLLKISAHVVMQFSVDYLSLSKKDSPF